MSSNDVNSADADSFSIGLQKIAEGEFAPTDFIVEPGDSDRTYILDQPGVVRVLEDGSFRDEPFLDIRDRVVELYYGHDERGLLGIAFHPDYEQNRTFYVRYSSPPRDDTPDDWDHTEILSEFEATDSPRPLAPPRALTIVSIIGMNPAMRMA